MNRRLTQQQRIFVCICFFKWESPSHVRTEYIQTFPGEVLPSKFRTHEIVKKFETTGSVANKKKRNHKRTVLKEETLDEIRASLEHIITKSTKLVQQVGISESSAHRTKLLKLKPYKCTSVDYLKQGDQVSWMHNCEWFHSSVNDGLTGNISSIFCKIR